MNEPDIEGVATHDDPESCAAGREVGGEALTGVRAGRVLSREITYFRVPTPLSEAEGNTLRHRHREETNDPARSQTPCTYGTSLHENRDSSGLLGLVARRHVGKAMSRAPTTNGPRRSDGPVIPMKPSNKAARQRRRRWREKGIEASFSRASRRPGARCQGASESVAH